MRQLSTVMFKRGGVRHLANKRKTVIWSMRGFPITLCGIDTLGRDVAKLDGDRKSLKYPLCKTCAKVRRLHDVDQVLPERNDAATRRAEAADAPVQVIPARVYRVQGSTDTYTVTAPVQVIPARVYRVQGSTDTYTVTVPNSDHLATLCNCMAGKVHPEKECKHAATVRLVTDKMGATA